MMARGVITVPAADVGALRKGGGKDRGKGNERKMRLYVRGIGTVVLPYYPEDIQFSGLSANYEEQRRPGRQPLLIRTGLSLREMRVGVVVSRQNLEARAEGNVQPILKTLGVMSRSKQPVEVKLAGRKSRWRMTDLGITELDWSRKGLAILAEVSMTFVELSDATVPVGPIKNPGNGGGNGGGDGTGDNPPPGGFPWPF